MGKVLQFSRFLNQQREIFMAIPVYLFLYDEGGSIVKGSVDVLGREGSIEVLELMQTVTMPVDHLTGKVTGKRVHTPYAFEKVVDCATPYLYQSLTSGKVFKKAEFVFYKINYSGHEEAYFKTILENVRVQGINSFLLDSKDPRWEKHTHHEYIDISYEEIIWHYLDGNIIHSDSWKKRA